MKNTLITFLFLSIPIFVYSQEDTVFIKYNIADYDQPIKYHTDTIVYPTPNARQLIYHTMLIPNSTHQIIAKNYGIDNATIEFTNCDYSGPKGQEIITNIKETADSLIIELKMNRNCCHAFLCDIEIVNDSIINLTQIGYGKMYCSCTCCFGLKYNIQTLQYFEEYHKLKYVMINDNRKTLKKIKG